MYKEGIICLIIVIGIVVGNIITQNYTKQSVTELSDALSELRNKVIENDINVMEEDGKKVEDKWEEKHNKLEKIETELTTIKSNIETNDYEHSIESIDRSIFLLKHVEDRYAFNLENIF